METRKVRILVVDDHEIVRKGVCALLSMQPDFEVVCDVADGILAVNKAEEFRPDVIVLDISMPGMDGLDVARRVKKALPGAAIAFLSQHASAEMTRQALMSGGDEYVVKSDIVKDLIAAIRRGVQKNLVKVCDPNRFASSPPLEP